MSVDRPSVAELAGMVERLRSQLDQLLVRRAGLQAEVDQADASARDGSGTRALFARVAASRAASRLARLDGEIEGVRAELGPAEDLLDALGGAVAGLVEQHRQARLEAARLDAVEAQAVADEVRARIMELRGMFAEATPAIPNPVRASTDLARAVLGAAVKAEWEAEVRLGQIESGGDPGGG